MDEYPITVFHDGSCPICRLDVERLRSRNDQGRLRFINIAAPEFDPGPYGLTLEEFAGQIRAQLPDGSLVTGMEVFRRAYRAVGLGCFVAPTDWAPLKTLAEALYRFFARRRSAISRRFGSVFEALAVFQAHRRARACRSVQCNVPGQHPRSGQ